MSFYNRFFPEIFCKKTSFLKKMVVKGLTEILNSRMWCPRAKPIWFLKSAQSNYSITNFQENQKTLRMNRFFRNLRKNAVFWQKTVFWRKFHEKKTTLNIERIDLCIEICRIMIIHSKRLHEVFHAGSTPKLDILLL